MQSPCQVWKTEIQHVQRDYVQCQYRFQPRPRHGKARILYREKLPLTDFSIPGWTLRDVKRRSVFCLSDVGGEKELFHRPFDVNPTLCLWLLTCQPIPSCISKLSNEEKNTGTDGRRRGGDCDR